MNTLFLFFLIFNIQSEDEVSPLGHIFEFPCLLQELPINGENRSQKMSVISVKESWDNWTRSAVGVGDTSHGQKEQAMTGKIVQELRLSPCMTASIQLPRIAYGPSRTPSSGSSSHSWAQSHSLWTPQNLLTPFISSSSPLPHIQIQIKRDKSELKKTVHPAMLPNNGKNTENHIGEMTVFFLLLEMIWLSPKDNIIFRYNLIMVIQL